MQAIATRKLEYDTERYPFCQVVSEILGRSDLDRLTPVDEIWKVGKDQASEYHAAFYSHLEDFLPLYRDFVRHVLFVERQQSRHILFQRVPTFRVHLPGNVAVGEQHRDGDYGHVDGEINYWVPVTDAWGTNTIWIGDEPQSVNYGEALIFDGVNLLHGNKLNDTGHSRVSFDFRLLPKRLYKPRTERSVSAGVRFIVGEYWDVL